MQVHRDGAVILPVNSRTKNGPVTSVRPSSLIRDYLGEGEVDWRAIILLSPTSVILCNDIKHRNYLMTRPRIRKQIRGR